MEGKRNGGRPKTPWEKDVEDWTRASVWGVGCLLRGSKVKKWIRN